MLCSVLLSASDRVHCAGVQIAPAIMTSYTVVCKPSEFTSVTALTGCTVPVFQIAPAIMTGNTVVCKPSEFTSVTAYKLAEVSLRRRPHAVKLV